MSRTRIIGFLTVADPRSRSSWSGTYYYMAEALKRNVGDIVYLGPIETRLKALGSLINWLSLRFFRRQYDYKRSRWYAKRLSAKTYNIIREINIDCIVAPAAASAFACMKDTAIPVIFVSDTTFALINNYYHGFSNYLPVSVRDGHWLAEAAMHRADIVLFPSQWAANSALDDYAVPLSRVHVIPFGANLDSIPSAEVAYQRMRSGRCRLLFLGVDWIRKGGDIAFETLLSLENDHGIRAELTVCGCRPPPGVSHERMKVVGFLNKQNPQQAEQLSRLFIETDYLLLPTRNECYGVVFCEASSYGVPSISTDTGGVSGVIAEGKNGYLLPKAERGDGYARVIAAIEADDEHYRSLCLSSRHEYDSRINWDVWARRVDSLLDAL